MSAVIENLPVWSWRPNWAGGVTESLEWLTDVLSSETMAEQRRMLRLSPRRGFEISINPKGRERTFFDNAMMKWGASDWYIPLWHDVEATSVDHFAGTMTVDMMTDFREFAPGNLALFLGNSAFEYEIVIIEGLTDTGVKLHVATAKDWPAGTRFYPLRKARIRDQVQGARKLNGAATQIGTAFDLTDANIGPDSAGWGFNWGFNWGGGGGPGEAPWWQTAGWGNSWGFNWGGTVPQDGYTYYAGYAVLTERPNEREQLTSGYTRNVLDIDNQTGLVTRVDLSKRSARQQQHMWLLRRRAQLAAFYKLCYKLKGRMIPMWLPTAYHDFELTSDVVNGSNFLNVELCGYTQTGGPAQGRDRIMIELYDGEPLFRRVVSSALVGDGERITLDSVIPVFIEQSNVRRVSFMELCRSNQDRFEITHHTDAQGVAESTVVWIAAPNTRVAPTNVG